MNEKFADKYKKITQNWMKGKRAQLFFAQICHVIVVWSDVVLLFFVPDKFVSFVTVFFIELEIYYIKSLHFTAKLFENI